MPPTLEGTLLCVVLGGALIFPPVAECRVNENVVRYETTAFLRCQDSDTRLPSSSALNYQWILPSGKILNFGKTTPNASAKHSLLRDGFILEIQNVDETDYGLYVCLGFPSNQTRTNNEILQIVKHSLNSNIWSGETPDYAVKTQYGFIAAFVVFVIMALTCYNYDQNQERCDIVVDTEQDDVSFEMRHHHHHHHSSNEHELPSIVVTDAENGRDNRGFQKDGIHREKSEADIEL